jgi:hypothetical protein
VAQSYFGASKFAEAYVLYKRAAEQAQSAVAEYKKVKHPSGVSIFPPIKALLVDTAGATSFEGFPC